MDIVRKENKPPINDTKYSDMKNNGTTRFLNLMATELSAESSIADVYLMNDSWKEKQDEFLDACNELVIFDFDEMNKTMTKEQIAEQVAFILKERAKRETVRLKTIEIIRGYENVHDTKAFENGTTADKLSRFERFVTATEKIIGFNKDAELEQTIGIEA